MIAGARSGSGFDDPLGVMADSHRRTERFLAALVTITTQAQGARLGMVEREALATALRYFRDAAPLHTEDEELSLFPRVRAAGGTIALPTPRLAGLHVDHLYMSTLQATVEALGSAWLASSRLGRRATGELSRALDRLAVTYHRHVAYEETEVYPLAHALLTRSALAEIGAEMAARRGLGAGSVTYLRLEARSAARGDQRSRSPGEVP